MIKIDHWKYQRAEFYQKMAESISDASVSQLFRDLAAMKAEHEKVFASMKADLADQEQKPIVFDPEGEAAQYLKALADLRVFDEQGKKVSYSNSVVKLKNLNFKKNKYCNINKLF